MGKQVFECDTCHKKFTRKDNLNRHKKKHTDHAQHQCKECGKVFAKADNLNEHRLTKHGSQMKKRSYNDKVEPPAKRLKEDVTEHYTLRKIGETRRKKFNTTKTTYKVNFKDLHVTGLKDILRALKDIFGSLIKKVTEDAKDSDLIRMSVQNPELDYPITIPFMRKDQLTVDRLLSEIERVLQSFEEFVLDHDVEIDIIHAEKPNGGTTKRCKYVDLQRFLQEKRCIIQIRNSDDLCAARAIVTAKAKLDNHHMWNSIRLGRGAQTTLAKELHGRANVPFGKCGIEEIKEFQRVLPDYQLHIISKEHGNAIIYDGPEAENKIYLYLHDDHFDIITSLPAFLGRNYFCHHCKKGYDHKERHKCNNPCLQCRNIHEDSHEDWVECDLCNRCFRGEECFRLHQKQTKHGNSTCSNYYKCLDCSYVVNKSKRKSKHKCGEVFCTTCGEYYLEGHQCYMQPYKRNQKNTECAENNMDTMNNTMNENEEPFGDDDAGEVTYIFFDFECRQESMQQCEAGYKICENTGKCKKLPESKMWIISSRTKSMCCAKGMQSVFR